MDTRITNLVVATLRPEDMYKVYVNYLKGTGKPQEFFACTPDGINAIFSSPFEAVHTFLEAETHYDNEMFMRRDDSTISARLISGKTRQWQTSLWTGLKITR